MTPDELDAHKTLCFARHCWKHKDERAPNMEAGRYFTWAEIFFRRTKIKLNDYAADRQADSGTGRESEGVSKIL